jgi:diadenosine tetraphosphate (Ap4A) HIT family hydrolase
VPHRISREEAVARLGVADGCPLCRLLVGSEGDVLHDDGEVVVRLSRYPTRWGQLMVVPRLHVERVADLELSIWLRVNELAHHATRALERALAPSRCYVASLGARRSDLPMTFPHVHLNVVPVSDDDTRPREVFTWQLGVLDGSEREWSELRELLAAAWDEPDPVRR